MSYSFLLTSGITNTPVVPVGTANNGQVARLNRKGSTLDSVGTVSNGKATFSIPAARVIEFAGSYSITVQGAVVQTGDVDVIIPPASSGGSGGGSSADLTNYFTKSQTTSEIVATITPKADKTYVDSQLSLKAATSALASYATNNALNAGLADKLSAGQLPAAAVSGSYNDLTNKPDLTLVALKTDLTPLVTESKLNQAIANAAAGGQVDLTAYVKSADLIPVTDDFVTQSELDSAIAAIPASGGSGGTVSLTATSEFTNVGWTGSDMPTGNSVFGRPTAPRIRYQRGSRLVNADELTKFVFNSSYGTHTGTMSVVTGISSPNPTGHIKFSNPGYTGTRWGIDIAPVDVTNSYLRVASTVSALSNVRWVRYYIAESKASFDAGNYIRWTAATASTNYYRNFFTHDALHPALGSVTGTAPSLSNIGYVVLELASNTTSNTFDFELAYIESVALAAEKAKCVIFHDDSTESGWSTFTRFMSRYNFPGTEAAMLGTAGTNNSTAEAIDVIRSMQYNQGWQFASHAFINGEHVDTDAAGIYSGAVKNRAVAAAIGVTGADDFAWWGSLGAGSGNYNAIRRSYRSGRYNTSNLTVPEMLPPADPWLTKSILVGSEAFDDWKTLVDNAIATRGMAQFTFHNYGNGAQLRQLLAYLDANRDKIDVVTLDEALQTSTVSGRANLIAIPAQLPVQAKISAVDSNGSPVITVLSRYHTGYKVFRGTAAGVTATGTPYATSTTVDAYTDANVTAGTTYYYKVVPTNGNGDGPASSEISFTTTGASTPPTGVPSLTLGTATATTQPISWTAVTGATGYKVEHKASSGSTWTVDAASTTDLTYTVTGLSANTTYDYRVSAVNSAGAGTASTVQTGSTLASGGGSQTGTIYSANYTTQTATATGVTDGGANFQDSDGAFAYNTADAQSTGDRGLVCSRRPTSGNANYFYLYKTAVAQKQSVTTQFKMGAVGTTVTSHAIVLCSSDVPSTSGSVPPATYYGAILDANGTVRFLKYAGATETVLLTSSNNVGTQAVGTEHTMTFEVTTSGATKVLAITVDGTSMGTYTDSSPLSGTYIGIRGRRNATSGNSPLVKSMTIASNA